MKALLAATLSLYLPNADITPGNIGPYSKDQLCAKSFSTKDIRNVSAVTKIKVYQSYGLAPNRLPCPCEVDHLVPLELGGSNDTSNLWPQSRITANFNANIKDKLENATHRLVCAGKLDLGDAQHGMAADWVGLYNAVIGLGHAKAKKARAVAQPRRIHRLKRPTRHRMAHRRSS